jgi:hypothetical protein
LANGYQDRKEKIRAVLEKRARGKETIFYSELGALVRIPATGPWKPVLDAISHEDRGAGRPDITYLVISKKTRLPAQIEFQSAKPPGSEQKQLAHRTIQQVFDYYAG